MKSKWLKLFALLAICKMSVMVLSAQGVVRVAAAANLRYALREIEQIYEAKVKGVDIQINYGASGTFYGQIINGAPFDLFLSADNILPAKLKSEGITNSESIVYACGKLALYGLRNDLQKLKLKALEQEGIGRIAIANPRTAPYGTRSVELLKSIGQWERLERRVVYGDSIAQAAQATMSGNCELGFVALSLLLNPESELKGSYFIIPENMYAPIAQAGIVLKRGAADDFFKFMLSAECKGVWERYGYSPAR